MVLLVGSTPAHANQEYVGAPDSPIVKSIRQEERFTFAWNAPNNNGAGITGYDLFARIMDREPDSIERVSWDYDFATSPWKKIASFASSARQGTLVLSSDYTDQFLEFALVAKNRHGSSPRPDIGWVDIAIGDNAACALNRSGQLYCWGDSSGKGELFSTRQGFTMPRAAKLPGAAQSVAAGLNHFCAIVSGDVYCWGNNEYRQAATNDGNVLTPTKVSLPSKAKSVTLGSSHSCALLVSGEAYCWGSNLDGQIGGDSDGAALKLPFTDIKKLDAGSDSTCALSNAGTLSCTGYIPDQYVQADENLGFLPASDFAAGDHVVCAITELGIQCMGFGQNGEAGVSYGTFSTPQLVPQTQGLLQSIETKRFGVCGLSEDSAVHCLGVSWAYLEYWDKEPSGLNPFTSRHYSGFLKPVELPNRAMAKLYDPVYGKAPTQLTDYRDVMYLDAYFNQQPRMRDPVKLGMGVGANCGIDSFGQLWCSRLQGRGDEKYSWINASVRRGFSERTMGYNYELDLSGAESDLVSLNNLLTPSSAFTITYRDSERGFTGRPSILGKHEAGQTLRARLPHRLPTGSHVEYLWYRGIGKFEPGYLHNFSLIGQSNSSTYTIREKDAQFSIALRVRIAAPGKYYEYDPSASLAPGEGQQISQPFGWTKRLGNTQAKLYAKDIIGAGKVSFRLNGREIAWVNALDASDRKLRLAGGSNYLVRTVNLVAGKNVLEIFMDGERVKRVVYSR